MLRAHPSQASGAPDASPDAVLVVAAQQAATAFEPLYARYRDDVLRYCFYCLSEWEEAADATQQVFTDAIAGLPRFVDSGDSFRSWLFRIAHNEVCTRQRRQVRQRQRQLVEADVVVDPAPSPEMLAIAAADHARIRHLMGALPHDQRRVCELRFAGLTDRDIARILGKSEGAVRTAQSRAIKQLRSLLRIEPARAGVPHV